MLDYYTSTSCFKAVHPFTDGHRWKTTPSLTHSLTPWCVSQCLSMGLNVCVWVLLRGLNVGMFVFVCQCLTSPHFCVRVWVGGWMDVRRQLCSMLIKCPSCGGIQCTSKLRAFHIAAFNQEYLRHPESVIEFLQRQAHPEYWQESLLIIKQRCLDQRSSGWSQLYQDLTKFSKS